MLLGLYLLSFRGTDAPASVKEGPSKQGVYMYIFVSILTIVFLFCAS